MRLNDGNVKIQLVFGIPGVYSNWFSVVDGDVLFC